METVPIAYSWSRHSFAKTLELSRDTNRQDVAGEAHCMAEESSGKIIAVTKINSPNMIQEIG
jgi:hypothetical protein